MSEAESAPKRIGRPSIGDNQIGAQVTLSTSWLLMNERKRPPDPCRGGS